MLAPALQFYRLNIGSMTAEMINAHSIPQKLAIVRLQKRESFSKIKTHEPDEKEKISTTF